MSDFSRFSTRKIRTVSFDNNVISDVPPFLLLSEKAKLRGYEKVYFKRTQQSYESIIATLSVNIEPIGIPIVREELSRKAGLVSLYDRIFNKNAQVNKETKSLANAYLRKVPLELPDALIIAIVSCSRIDAFLSWNRDDIINKSNLQKIQEINKRRNFPFPIFATPAEFLERIFLSDKKTICLSGSPVPPQFRLRIFEPK